MVNKQKGVQQDTAYSTVVVHDHMYPPVPAYIILKCFYDPFGSKTGIPNYDHALQLHYRQYLVALLFADLASLSLFIS